MVETSERKVKISASGELRHQECLESVRADEITNMLAKAWRHRQHGHRCLPGRPGRPGRLCGRLRPTLSIH
jgi:hypothetical protein